MKTAAVLRRRLKRKYEINPLTMALIPIHHEGKVYSRILELNDQFISPFSPFQLIKEACRFFGVPYSGRKEGTKQLTGATRKIPIAISPPNSIYFFPTTSPEKADCNWLSFEHIYDYVKYSKDITLVIFRDKQEIKVPVSYGSFRNQMSQTDMLKRKHIQRIAAMNQMYRNKRRIPGEGETWDECREFLDDFDDPGY